MARERVEAHGGGFVGRGSRRGSCGCGGTRGSAMLQYRGQLPDDMGVRFEAEIKRRDRVDEAEEG